MSHLSDLSGDQLREILQTSHQTVNSLVMSLANRPDMQNAIARLMGPENMLETFYELASAEPDVNLPTQGRVGEVCVVPGGFRKSTKPKRSTPNLHVALLASASTRIRPPTRFVTCSVTQFHPANDQGTMQFGSNGRPDCGVAATGDLSRFCGRSVSGLF